MSLSLFELLLSLLATVSAIVTSLYLIRKFNQAQTTLTDLVPSLDDFIFQENGEWQIDERLVKVFDLIGSRMALSMRQSFFQGQGVQAKIKKGFEKALTGDIIESQLPFINLIPGAKAYLQKNPSAIQYALPFMQQFMKGNSPGQSRSREGVGYG